MTPTATHQGFARPGPHLVLKDAFGAAMVGRLLAYAVSRESDFLMSVVGAEGRIDKSVRRSHRLDVSGPIRPAVEAGFRSALLPARSAFGIAAFEPTSLSLELAVHGDGDFYGRHIDTHVRPAGERGDRVLTGVYYFHAEPKAFSGGELRLHSLLSAEEGGSHADIDPANDSLVLFPSWVPHEVRPVSCPGVDFARSRFAINCWYDRSRS